MKKICMLTDGRYYWEKIAQYLRGINAEVIILTNQGSLRDHTPDLIVMTMEQFTAAGIPVAGTPRIVIDDSGGRTTEYGGTAGKKTKFIAWPFSRREFLEETASLLGLHPRRAFRAVIRVTDHNEEIGAIGTSVDFSMTGMSFSAKRSFDAGQKVTVSLSLPRAGDQLLLAGRIVRALDEDEEGTRTYGVAFGRLDPGTSRGLQSFILD